MRLTILSVALLALAGVIAWTVIARKPGDCALLVVWYEQLRIGEGERDISLVRLSEPVDRGLFRLPVQSLAVRDPSAETATIYDFKLNPVTGSVFDLQAINVTLAEWQAHRKWDCDTWERDT